MQALLLSTLVTFLPMALAPLTRLDRATPTVSTPAWPRSTLKARPPTLQVPVVALPLASEELPPCSMLSCVVSWRFFFVVFYRSVCSAARVFLHSFCLCMPVCESTFSCFDVASTSDSKSDARIRRLFPLSFFDDLDRQGEDQLTCPHSFALSRGCDDRLGQARYGRSTEQATKAG